MTVRICNPQALSEITVPNPAGQSSASRLSGSQTAASGVEIINPNAQLFERRQEPRHDCDDEGSMVVLPGEAAIACRLMDQSSGGARVMFDSAVNISGEIWLVRKGNPNVCRATMAWAMPHRMGLKFNLILPLSPNAPCPPKVPKSVFEQWMNVNHPTPKAEPKSDDDDTFFLD